MIKVDEERGAIVVHGSVPGKPGNVLEITPAKIVGKTWKYQRWDAHAGCCTYICHTGPVPLLLCIALYKAASSLLIHRVADCQALSTGIWRRQRQRSRRSLRPLRRRWQLLERVAIY